jgi:hypothetical protein
LPNNPGELTAHSAGFCGTLEIFPCRPQLTGSVLRTWDRTAFDEASARERLLLGAVTREKTSRCNLVIGSSGGLDI